MNDYFEHSCQVIELLESLSEYKKQTFEEIEEQLNSQENEEENQ